MKRFALTLWEVVLGLLLIVFLAGFFGTRIYRDVDLHRFKTNVKRLYSELATFRYLSLTTQSDWCAILKKQDREWILEGFCIQQPQRPRFSPLHLGKFDLILNEEMPAVVVIDFFSTGEFSPHGMLTICQDVKDSSGVKQQWNLSQIFRLSEKESIEIFENMDQ